MRPASCSAPTGSRFRIRPRVRFRRNVIFGHVLVWIGELSLFFPSALAALIVFDHFGEKEVFLWRLVGLPAVLFAVR